MTSIILVILIITQCLSFYFIVLLGMKISKLKDVEQKQQLLKDDLDNAIGMYLAEMKDENDRFIAEIQQMKKELHTPVATETVLPAVMEETTNRPNVEVVEAAAQKNASKPFAAPKAYVKNAYTKQQVPAQPKPLTVDERAKKMYKEGIPIDEIAKQLQRGKTEIELMLKFQS